MPRDLTPARRGVPATAEGWQSTADDLTVLRKIAAAERAIYGHVTAATAQLLAERMVEVEADIVMAKASGVVQ